VDGTTSIVILKKSLEFCWERNVRFTSLTGFRDGTGCEAKWWRRPRRAGLSLIGQRRYRLRANDVVRSCNSAVDRCDCHDHHLSGKGAAPWPSLCFNSNRLDCPIRRKNLCGAGVAFKLIDALFAVSGVGAGTALATDLIRS